MHPMIKFWVPLAVVGAILLAYVMGHCAGSNDTARNARDAKARKADARLRRIFASDQLMGSCKYIEPTIPG